MTTTQIIFAILLNSIWVIPLFYELIFIPLKENMQFRKRNTEYNSNHEKRLRLKCVDCNYCISFLDRSFHKNSKYANSMRMKLPKYCKKFRKELKWDPLLRCISKENEFAMYDENVSK